ncbi:DUF1659 domain-containing protein [Bacillus sp. SM2101]|uniref:DUF1659 domain-containing protein n=1 Tax=Bacillus sp. SM2101 TaxID=2805366 RepID=UPI002032F092|nr:DUF1659 domain-containing protein [Bacillus sp. SM2101]
MAQAIITDSQLRVIYDLGIDEEGKQIFRNKNYNNVKTQATTDELYTAAEAIISLQENEVHRVERNDSQQLVQ